jgi:hypothetical protein
MDQLTLLLASTTCQLCDVLKLVRQQQALVETLQAEGRATSGAEVLLEIFRESAAAIAAQRSHLEAQVIRLGCKSDSNTDITVSLARRTGKGLWVAVAALFGLSKAQGRP